MAQNTYQPQLNRTQSNHLYGTRAREKYVVVSDWPTVSAGHQITQVYFQFTLHSWNTMYYSLEPGSGNRTSIPTTNGQDMVKRIDVPSQKWNASDCLLWISNVQSSTQTPPTTSAWVQNMTLTVITSDGAPAETASYIAVQPTTVGSTGGYQTAEIHYTSPSVSHRVSWQYGNDANTRGEMSVQPGISSVTYRIHENILNQFPANSDTVQGNVSVSTYNSAGQLIGTNTSYGRCIMSSTVGAPTFSIDIEKGWIAATPSDILNREDADEVYIQSFSTITISPHYTQTSFKYGASPVSVTYITPDGTGSISDEATITVMHAGEYPISITVTDSRGFATTVTETINVLSCAAPVIYSMDIHRCKSGTDTNADDEGKWVSIRAVYDLGFYEVTHLNSATITLNGQTYTYGGQGGSIQITSVDDTSTQVTRGIVTTVIDANLNTTENYPISIEVIDNYGLPNTYNGVIASTLYTIYRQAGGRSVAFGKVADLNGVEVDPEWPFYTHNKEILDLIIDLAHPVGSIIQMINDDDPNVLWPHTLWQKLQGCFLFANDGRMHTLLTTGGSADNGIQGYDYEYPANQGHWYSCQPTYADIQMDGNFVIKKVSDDQAVSSMGQSVGFNSQAIGHTVKIGKTAAQRSENNMPPYLVVNMWVRIK